jgi:hypothetical protein
MISSGHCSWGKLSITFSGILKDVPEGLFVKASKQYMALILAHTIFSVQTNFLLRITETCV